MAPTTDPTAAREKWNRRYQNATEPNPPAEVLSDNHYLLPKAGTALEIACGLGGNALYLAARGLETEAWDVSSEAINKLRQFTAEQQVSLDCRVLDIQPESLPKARFDLICISHYLDRNLCHAISQALKPGGLLFYQTYTCFKPATDTTAESGPHNADFLLQRGELLQLFSTLHPIVYRDNRDCGDIHTGLRNQAYLVAQKATG